MRAVSAEKARIMHFYPRFWPKFGPNQPQNPVLANESIGDTLRVFKKLLI